MIYILLRILAYISVPLIVGFIKKGTLNAKNCIVISVTWAVLVSAVIAFLTSGGAEAAGMITGGTISGAIIGDIAISISGKPKKGAEKSVDESEKVDIEEEQHEDRRDIVDDSELKEVGISSEETPSAMGKTNTISDEGPNSSELVENEEKDLIFIPNGGPKVEDYFIKVEDDNEYEDEKSEEKGGLIYNYSISDIIKAGKYRSTDYQRVLACLKKSDKYKDSINEHFTGSYIRGNMEEILSEIQIQLDKQTEGKSDDNHNESTIYSDSHNAGEVTTEMTDNSSQNANDQGIIPDAALRSLKALYDDGVLTEEEFKEKKKMLLGI